MALPASGPISMSMINVELGNSATQGISFQSIATSFELTAPNYGDSKIGLGLDELYGDSAGSSVTATFNDFNIMGFTVNTQDGSIISNPFATAGSNPVPSLTVSYVGSPFSAVLTETIRTSNVTFTVPSENESGVTYDNAGSTLSGQTFTAQGAYQFEFDDWTGGIANINPNTGVVTFTPGNDSNTGIGSISNTTTFSQTSNPTPTAGQFKPSATSFSAPVGTNTTRTITFTLGVPSTNLDGSGGQYGNVGSTVSGTKTFTQLVGETVSLSGEGIGTDPLIWTNSQSGTGANKSVQITTGGGDGSVGWTATVLVDLSGGGISTDFEVSLNSDGSGGQSAVTGTGNDFIYIYPTSTNTNVATKEALIFVSTDAGATDSIDLEQSGQITFSLNPSPGSGTDIEFDHSGSVTSGQNTGTLSSNVSWVLNITGSAFTFETDGDPGFSTNQRTGNGNEDITVQASANLGGVRYGTFNLDTTTANTTGNKIQVDLEQSARPVDSGIFTNTVGSMSGSFGILVDVERNITQSQFSPYHYSPTFIPIAVQTNYATTYTVSVDSVSHGRISTTHDSSGNGAGSQTLSGISTITSTPGTSDTQFFFNTITESQHSSTRQSILTFTFADGRTDELTIKMHGSGGGGGNGGPPSP